MNLMLWVKVFFSLSLIQIIRYFVFAGGAYFIFWNQKIKWVQDRRIQLAPYKKSELWREVRQSIGACFIFALVFSIPFYPEIKKRTLLYTDISDYGLLWTVMSFFVLIALHDTYFYWMHRIVHRPSLYRWIHATHHLSVQPSPWTSYSFHPFETFLEAIWIVPVLFLIPIHITTLVLFSILSLYINVVGHLGVEIYPSWWKKHPILKWLNTSTFHNHHHQFFKGNYGLYFIFWDYWMNTLRSDDLKLVR